jgi:aminoglycoside 6'-N-acetyltransferase I
LGVWPAGGVLGVSMHVEQCAADAITEWLLLRLALWPSASEQEHRQEIAAILSQSDHAVAFLLWNDGAAIGFAEATLRPDYVCECERSPVAFLEGIFV